MNQSSRESFRLMKSPRNVIITVTITITITTTVGGKGASFVHRRTERDPRAPTLPSFLPLSPPPILSLLSSIRTSSLFYATVL